MKIEVPGDGHGMIKSYSCARILLGNEGFLRSHCAEVLSTSRCVAISFASKASDASICLLTALRAASMKGFDPPSPEVKTEVANFGFAEYCFANNGVPCQVT